MARERLQQQVGEVGLVLFEPFCCYVIKPLMVNIIEPYMKAKGLNSMM